MNIHAEFKQKNGGDPTLDWNLIRVGKVTASEVDALISPLGEIRKGIGPHTYLCKKLAETWLGGQLPSTFNGNFSTEQGNIIEELAIPFAAFEYGLDIQQVGFVSSDCGRLGCSPDALVGFRVSEFSATAPTPYKLSGNESGIEIKSPNLENHIRYLLAGKLPVDYVAQIQFSMLITGCKTWHFLSYRRNLPALHLIIPRDDKFCAALQQALDDFLLKFDMAMSRLLTINGGPPSPRNRGSVPFPNLEAGETENADLVP